MTLLGLFDLSAAFDTVGHDVLLGSLHHGAGVRDPVLRWFTSYLEGRSAGILGGFSIFSMQS